MMGEDLAAVGFGQNAVDDAAVAATGNDAQGQGTAAQQGAEVDLAVVHEIGDQRQVDSLHDQCTAQHVHAGH